MGPTKAFISHEALRHNFNLVRQAVGPTRVMAVVKADAYGHGAVEVAQTLIRAGADWLGVAFPEEGIELRQAGITAPILVFGAHLPEYIGLHREYNLDLTLTSFEQLEFIEKEITRPLRVHLKFDTGMHRVGFFAGDLPRLVQRLLKLPLVDVCGIYSHLSSADDDADYTAQQISAFRDIRSAILHSTNWQPIFHIANSAALMLSAESRFDMVRPGIMLYGHPPAPAFPLTWNLKQVMQIESRITLIKTLAAGKAVSYNQRYITKGPTKIAIVPAGYADGFNRLFTNSGQVLIQGILHPVIGTVCMDQIVILLENDREYEIGEAVVISGRQGDQVRSITQLAAELKTIPYEITCRIARRVTREHVR